MTELEEARQRFAGDAFATDVTGCVIEEVGDRYARCSLTLEDHHRNIFGQVMGGATYTLADFAFAVASNFHQPPTVTLTCQISYLCAVKGNKLYAQTHLIKDGRHNCFYEISVIDDMGTPVAAFTVTGAHLQMEKENANMRT